MPEVTSRISSESQVSSIEETETFITSLIHDRHLNATLRPRTSSRPAVLQFAASSREGPLARSENNVHGDLLCGRLIVEQFNKQMKGAERKLELTKEYLDHLRRQKRAGPNGGIGGDVKSGGLIPGVFPIDDDMMAEM